MSNRRRRSEASWERKEDEGIRSEKIPWHGKEFSNNSSFRGSRSPKRSNSEVNDALIPSDFKNDPGFDEWENQYTSSRPLENSYDMPYRSVDRGPMRKDRERSSSWSPHRIKGRERRSRSRSRGRGRSDERRESYEQPLDQRNISRNSSFHHYEQPFNDSRNNSSSHSHHRESYEPFDQRNNPSSHHRSNRSDGSRFRGGDERNLDDRPRIKGSDYTRKDSGPRNTNTNTTSYDDRRQPSQTSKAPCRFFSMGKCNRSNCKFSHDVQKSEGIYEGRSHDNNTTTTTNNNNSRGWNERQPQDQVGGSSDLDEKNKSWTGPTWDDWNSGGWKESEKDSSKSYINQESLINLESDVIPEQVTDTTATDVSGGTHQQIHSYGQNARNTGYQFPSDLNGTHKTSPMPSSKVQPNGGSDTFLPAETQNQESLEASRNDNPQPDTTVASTTLTNALELLYSLPKPVSSGHPVDSVVPQQNLDTKPKESVVVNEPVNVSQQVEQGNQMSSEPVDPNPIKPENLKTGKSEAQGRGEEGNLSNDEKAIRVFKNALVEFVKEILKPTWKEGKMSKDDYKIIVKKVVDKVTSTIQGNQIPKTQEKIDQYLTFSKSKIAKLVEAYVGRFQKA